MIDHRSSNKKLDGNSISSSDSSKTFKSVWNRLSHLFHLPENSNNRRLSTSSSESNESSSNNNSNSSISNNSRTKYRRKKVLSVDYGDDSRASTSSQFVIPPYSPTYCKANEFPYSNFYVKLPNGKWMVRYRSGNRDILGTDEFEGYMI